MDVISNSAARYVRMREEEMSLDEYLALCQRDPMAYASAAQRMLMVIGEVEAGAWSCGMVAGLIHDIPTVRELIERTMSQAETLIRRRLAGALEGEALTPA